MKIEPTFISRDALRVAQWFDARLQKPCFVIENCVEGEWRGLALNGIPQKFGSRKAAQAKLELVANSFLVLSRVHPNPHRPNNNN